MASLPTLYLTTLRNQESDSVAFRQAAEGLAQWLAIKSVSMIQPNSMMVTTPLDQCPGEIIGEEIMLVPILRAGLSMLAPFLSIYPSATVGFFGYKRNEETKVAHQYYENIPPILPKQRIIILDPMLATAGTLLSAVDRLIELGANEEQLLFSGMIASTHGREQVQQKHPEMTLLLAGEDGALNKDAFIVPGLGDFGDRFYGTEG